MITLPATFTPQDLGRCTGTVAIPVVAIPVACVELYVMSYQLETPPPLCLGSSTLQTVHLQFLWCTKISPMQGVQTALSDVWCAHVGACALNVCPVTGREADVCPLKVRLKLTCTSDAHICALKVQPSFRP